MMRKIFFTFLLFHLAFICTAQDTISLDPVSISASLKPLNVSRTGRNIIVIRGEDMIRLPVHSVDELLRYLPGVEVQMRGPAGSQSDIVIRGGTFQQVLVIIDGVRLNDPNSGHFTGYFPIAPSEIDRIEIVKGASSAIYGSEAVGGVVNIISKTFAAKKGTDKKTLMANGYAGEYGLLGLNAGCFYNKKNTAVALGIITNNTEGQLQRGTRGFFHNNTASFSLKHFFNEFFGISIRSAYDRRNFGAQNFYTTFKSDTAREAVETFWNQVNLQYKKGANLINVDAGYKKVYDRYAFNSAGAPNRNHSELLQSTASYERIISSTASITGGFNIQGRKIMSNDRGDHDLLQTGLFAILNQSIGKLSIAPAVRVEHAENSGTELVPQLNVSYREKNIQVRGSAGKTIRQADFTERYNNYNKTLVTSGSIGNPFLEAERSFSYELGADLFIRNILRLSATAFERDQQKLIDWIPTSYANMPRKTNLSPTGTYALSKNIASVTTKGIETDLQFNKQFKSSRLIITGGLTWLMSKSSDTVPSFYLSSHARFSSILFAAMENRYGSISATCIYKERRKFTAPAINATLSPRYFIMSAKASVNIIKQFSVFAEVDNLFDKKFSDLLGSEMPGRWTMAGFSLKL